MKQPILLLLGSIAVAAAERTSVVSDEDASTTPPTGRGATAETGRGATTATPNILYLMADDMRPQLAA